MMSKQAEHTPGPWIADEGTFGGIRAEVYRGRKCKVRSRGEADTETFPSICEVRAWPQDRWDFLGPEETRANLSLISAAPDLLAACEAYLVAKPQCECTDTVGCSMAAARGKAQEAIAKARGTP